MAPLEVKLDDGTAVCHRMPLHGDGRSHRTIGGREVVVLVKLWVHGLSMVSHQSEFHSPMLVEHPVVGDAQVVVFEVLVVSVREVDETVSVFADVEYTSCHHIRTDAVALTELHFQESIVLLVVIEGSWQSEEELMQLEAVTSLET